MEIEWSRKEDNSSPSERKGVAKALDRIVKRDRAKDERRQREESDVRKALLEVFVSKLQKAIERNGIDPGALQAELRGIVEQEKDPAKRLSRLQELKATVERAARGVDVAALRKEIERVARSKRVKIRWTAPFAFSIAEPVRLTMDDTRASKPRRKSKPRKSKRRT